MIIVYTYRDENKQERVDFGVNTINDRVVIMPNYPIESIGAKWDVEGQFWYLEE